MAYVLKYADILHVTKQSTMLHPLLGYGKVKTTKNTWQACCNPPWESELIFQLQRLLQSLCKWNISWLQLDKLKFTSES